MELKHVKGIGPAKQEKFNAAGIDTVEALARADVATVAQATGMSASTVKEYKEKAVALTLLEDVKGVGPKTVVTLAEAGIKSLRDLADASSERIAKEAQVAQEKAKEWKDHAEVLLKRIAEDAKTPEGRKKLANEGRDVAVKTAEKAQVAAKDALAKAQKEGEAAIAKAKELQEKAPGMIADAREKTTAAVKDAEVQIREAGEKAQTFVKTEAEKVKAANEGFLTRLKARFNKN